jgi:tetratricopeptide (TPR) repeat protein
MSASRSVLLSLLLACACAQRVRAQATQPVAPAPNVPDAGSAPPANELQQLDESVARIAEAARRSAEELLARKDYPGALKALQQAHELDPKHAGAATRLAELYALLGNYARAEQVYREALALDPEQAAPNLGLAELLARDKHDSLRLAEAASLLARARELSGNDPAIIVRQARVAASAGHFEEAERDYAAYVERAGESDELRIELGDFLRDFGRTEQALAYYRKVSPSLAPARVAAQRIFELDVEREARELGLAQKDDAIPEQARAWLQKAQRLAEGGMPAEADRLVRRAISLAPNFGEARAELGDLLRAQKRPLEAELEYLRGLALDPSDVGLHVRLAELYLADAESERAGEAALVLERALGAHPELSALQLRLAHAYRRAGDLPRALFHAKRFLAQASAGPNRDAALALRSALERLLGSPGEAAPAQAANDAADLAPIARARAYLARGRTDAALAELRRVPNVLRTADVLTLEARVLHAAGRSAEAARVLEGALARDPGRPELLEELGLVLWALSRMAAARARFVECEARGSAACSFELARLDAASGDHGALAFLYDAPRLFALLDARARIERLRARDSLPLRSAELSSLRAELDGRLFTLSWAALAAALLCLLLQLVLRARLFGGHDVAELIERHPEAGPEAMRILSSIRHEVLKHNSMALAGVCQALERGEPGVADKAAHLERALFGDGTARHGGAHARLLGYAAELRRLARAHGLRLNLRRRDRALGPLLAGFAQLSRSRSALRRVDAQSPGARARLLRRLTLASDALHVRGYAGLRETLDRIRFFEVDAGVLERVFARTRGEPALASAQISPLALAPDSALPCSVRMPEHAFADVMTNLLRNALEASLNEGNAAAAEVGLVVRSELDAATGLEQIAFLVLDRARDALPERALHARYIEAGLGLTADLVARYEGSLTVEADVPGWSKAVVLRLPGGGTELAA